MASYSSVHDVFSSEVFDVLRNTSVNFDSGNVLHIVGGISYIWHGDQEFILATKISDKQDSESVSNSQLQTLMLSDAPLHPVNRILVNDDGSAAVLYGQRGLTFVSLPRRWGRSGMFEDGKERIICRSSVIGEMYYSIPRSSNNVRVRHVLWSPDVSLFKHLAVLSSDNHIRVFDTSTNGSVPVHDIAMYEAGLSMSSTCLSSTYGPAADELGETAVSFDIGLPWTASETVKTFSRLPVQSALTKYQLEPDALVYPYFVLFGNGDVYLLWISYQLGLYVDLPVLGPLLIHPSAEDNYGVDACDIVCLQSQPPVVVVTTCSGKIYHSLLLLSAEVDEPINSLRGSFKSMSVSKRSACLVSCCLVALYVVETVDLELNLTAYESESEFASEEENAGYSSTLPIVLYRDSSTNARYHCTHAAGVHTVAVPFVQMLRRLSEENYVAVGSEDMGAILNMVLGQASVVEHLLCTRPLSSSPVSFLIGFSVYPVSLLTPACAVCVLSNYEVQLLHLSSIIHRLLPPLFVEECHNADAARKPESFLDHIHTILQRTKSNPIFKGGLSNTNASSAEYVELLSNAISVLQEQYVDKLKLAKDELEKRVVLLSNLFEEQQRDVVRLNRSRLRLTEDSESLAEKFEDIGQNQQNIAARVESILTRMNRRTPVVSDSERSMYNELLTIEQNCNILNEQLNQIKSRCPPVSPDLYPGSPVTGSGDESDSRSVVDQAQIDHLKDTLRKENRDIAKLKSDTTELQRSLRQ